MDTIDITRERLRHDHDELRVVMRRFAAYLTAAGGHDRVTLLRERLAFSRLFGPHVIAEELSVKALDTKAMTPAEARDVTTYQDSLRDLRLDYSEHIAVWTPDAIAEDWRHYGQAVIALQRRLLDTMAWEERAIHPLIARAVPLAA